MKVVVLKDLDILDSLIEDLLLEDSPLLGMMKTIGSVRNVGVENIGLRESGKINQMVLFGLDRKLDRVK